MVVLIYLMKIGTEEKVFWMIPNVTFPSPVIQITYKSFFNSGYNDNNGQIHLQKDLATMNHQVV